MTLRPVFAAVVAVLCAPAASAQTPTGPAKFALLVGCTEYPNHPNLRTLYGPANDTRLWGEVLTKGFGFPEGNVTRLVGWPDDPAGRPTADNIRRACENMIERVGPGSQVVVVLSGHGLQTPLPPTADPLDPKNFEPDGLDEVFLPADVEKADADGQLKNALPDNQVAGWLDRLRAKGAHVLIVFDCCHSGTMTRGAADLVPGVREISRVADPNKLGITQEQIEKSVTRAREAVKKVEARGIKVAEPETVKPAAAGGSLVAFFAAQPFEEAPELPLPEGVPIKRENYYGLMSFTLLQAIQQRQNPLTYRELTQILAAHYRTVRGSRGPVPFAEGDLDREVLGMNVWPDRANVVLQRDKEKLRVSAGELRGITPGSILAVHPPAGDPRDPKSVLGFVRVESATVSSASVTPCGFENTPAAAAGSLPDRGRCTVAARDYGNMRVKLHVADAPAVRAGYEAVAADVRGMMQVVPSEADADWVLKAVTPKEAADQFKLTIPGKQVLLLQSDGVVPGPGETKAAMDRLQAAGKPLPRRVFGVYPAEPSELTPALDRDLPKLFKWQNVWRVAGGLSGDRGGSADGLKLEVAKLKSEDDRSEGEILRSGHVPNNTVIQLRVKNEGRSNLWVAAVWLDAEMGIDVYEVISVEAGKDAKFTPGVIEKQPGQYGREGVVLFAFPQSIQPEKPDLKFLEQSPLRGEAKRAAPNEAPNTPFGELVRANAMTAGTRAPRKVVPVTPSVLTQSWFVTP